MSRTLNAARYKVKRNKFRLLQCTLVHREIILAYCTYIQYQLLLSFGIIAWGGAQKIILSPLSTTQISVLKV